jgi:hypothetical protein
MSYKKLRPKQVKVMGKSYAIVFVADCTIEHENLGQCDHKKMTIAVQDHQAAVEEADTLLHEILHAIWYQMSINCGPMDEEPIVRRMTSGFMQVFLDNPELLKYLSAIKNKE